VLCVSSKLSWWCRWCPIRPTLPPAGGPLLNIFKFQENVPDVRWSPSPHFHFKNSPCNRLFFVCCFVFLCLGNLQLAIACGKVIHVWEVSSGECIRTLEGHSSNVYAVSWSSDGTRICSGGGDSTVRVWEVSSGECIRILQGHSSNVHAVSRSRDDTRICSGSYDCTVRVWEVSSRKCVSTSAPMFRFAPLELLLWS